MPRRRLIFAAVLLATPVGLVARAVETTAGPAIVVRSYKPWISARDFKAAGHTAAAILGHAGIGVTWLECSSHDRPGEISADCQQPLRSNELILRVVPVSDDDSGSRRASLGSSMIDNHAGAGSLSTVYADHVAALARRARVDGVVLLARTIAHEIGHLLLGTNRHAASGLMRAAWAESELRRNATADWLFSEEEAQAMRTALAVRGRSPGLTWSDPSIASR